MPLIEDPDSASSDVGGIEPSAIVAALDAIGARPEFARSRRQVDLLRYVVHAALRGEGADLKEYTVGVSALGKSQDFDPKLDSSVRSEASRIRTKLDALYEADPGAYPVRIRLPKGSYRPTFERIAHVRYEPAAVTQASEVAGVTAGTKPAQRLWSSYAPAIAVAAVIVVGAWMLGSPKAPPASLLVARFDTFNGDRRFPMISPDGSQAVFSEGEEARPYLFVSNPDGNPVSLGQQGEHAAWSPDGTRLAFRSQRAGGGLFVLHLATNRVRQVSAEGFHPAWSPDGSHLVYSSDRFVRPEERPTAKSVLTLLDLATGAARRLEMAPPVKDAIQPAWSPDGKWIAFWSVDTGGRRDVFVVAAGGGIPVRITQPDPLDWGPAWSPDGRLYWSSNQNGATTVWRVHVGADGAPAGSPQSVALPAAYAGFPSFTRDGRMLYANVRPLSSIFRTTIAADGLGASQAVRVTPETLRLRHPSMSPDGTSFVAYTVDPQEDLVIFRRDGTGMRRLTNDEFRDRGPEWSPDGRRIAFVSNRGGDYQLWSIQPDGQGLEAITNRPQGAFAPVWSRDGERLAWFERGFRAHISHLGAPARETALQAAAGNGFVPAGWWRQDRELLGEIPLNRDGIGNPLVSYSIDDGTLRAFDVRGSGPRWLIENQVLLFTRENAFYAFNVAARKETRLLSLPGSVDPRSSLSGADRFLYFEMRESRVELWTARVR